MGLIYASTFKVLLLRNILSLKYKAGAKKTGDELPRRPKDPTPKGR
jgi:hypothetical protein